MKKFIIAFGFVLFILLSGVFASDGELKRIKYNNPGLVVDLGVGLWAWPMPMDYDKDGDYDLVVVCPDKPYNGTYFFENKQGNVKMPVFEPAVRISKGGKNIQVSYVNGKPRVLSPGYEHKEFFKKGIDTRVKLPVQAKDVYTNKKLRAKQWKYADYDGDGLLDIVAGYGDWTEYGWDDAYNSQGVWTNGPLHGYVFWLRNMATNGKPKYEKSRHVTAGGKKVDVYGCPSPNFADFDGDGDLDLLCGEFRDTFTYFQNTGSRTKPTYAAGKQLKHGGKPLTMDLEMITPVAFDWDSDGDMDLICGDEDGRVALIEHTGKTKQGVPEFKPPAYFRQKADNVKFGALATPFGVDWDGDGDEDIICGNTAGYIGFFENLGGGAVPKWDRVKLLKAGGETLRIMAGPNGSIQGPCESKWGYTTQTVADWDHDGLPDIIANSIWGKVVWYRNIGKPGKPKLAAAQPIEVEWDGPAPKPAWNWWEPRGKELVTQWRTTPMAVDWNRDGLTDLVMLDHEGQLAFYERSKRGQKTVLLPGKQIFVDEKGEPMKLIRGPAGGSGRRKLQVVDWDGDGRLDVLFNGINADFYRNMGERDGKVLLKNMGPMDPRKISGHTSSPTVVDWDRNGIPDLLVGSEDGHLYFAENPRSATADRPPNIVFILADDMGRELLSSYGGQSNYRTPVLNRLARDGMQFNTCYATPLCVPSRTELLTGRYSFRNYTNWEELDRTQITFAQLLKKAGYKTAMAGKWHPHEEWNKKPVPPVHCGFDVYCSYDSHKMLNAAKAGKGNRFWGGTINRNGREEKLDRYGPEVFSDFLVDFIRENRTGPFMAYYCLTCMHRPFQPTPEHPDAPAPGQPAPKEWMGSKGSPENFRPMLRYADKMIGKLIAAVDDLGLADNTVFIFAADNGTDNVSDAKTIRSRFMDQMVKGGKYFPSELGVNVPLLAYWPGKIAAGSICDELVDFTDLLPTMLDIARAPLPADYPLDGRSILPLMQGLPAEPKLYTYTWGNYENSSRRYKAPAENQEHLLDVIRGERFKLYSDGRLFNAQKDPLEEHPIPAGHNPVAEKARRELQAALNKLRQTEPKRW